MPDLLNINDFHQLYRRTLKGVGSSGEVVTIKLDRIGPGRIRVLSHVTVEDETSDFTKCRIGIENGGNVHYLDELKTVVAGELVIGRSDVLLGENDRFFAELTGTTDGDSLILTCCGWVQGK